MVMVDVERMYNRQICTRSKKLGGGTYFSTPETPYINRSIPYCNPKYGQWQLMVDLPVESSIVAPAPSFQTPGGGIQLQFNAGALPASYGIPANQCYLNADMLVKFGLVIRIK